jgi:anti-sigma factor ChrR (cupin superfamily)
MDHHLSEETLLDYAHGRLSDEQELAVEAHFEWCQLCLNVVEAHLQAQINFTKLYKPIPSPSLWEKELIKRLEASMKDELLAAQNRSLQFEAQVTAVLERTRTDISSVDWRHDVPALLKEALQHVSAQLTKEHNMLQGVNDPELRYETTDEEVAYTHLLKDIFEENFRVHTRLHGLLIGARSVFFEEQERQAFRPRS